MQTASVLSLLLVPTVASAQVSALPSNSAATQQQAVSIVSQEQADLAEAQMESLAARLHRPVLLEGTLTQADYKALGALFATATQEDDARTLLNTVAERLDCVVQEEEGGFLLLRDYSKGTALPYITLEETERTAQSIADLLSPFDASTHFATFGTREGGRGAGFISTLKGGDKEKLHSGVPIASLSPKQQQECWFLVLSVTVNTKDTQLQAVQTDLKALVKANIFGHEYHDAKGGLQQRPLSNPTASYTRIGPSGGGSSYTPLLGFQGAAGNPEELIRATEPDTKPRPQSAHQLSLDALCSLLTQRGLPEPVSVAPSIGRKPCTSFGLTQAPPEKILQALLPLFGVERSRLPDSSGRIVGRLDLPPVPRPAEIADLYPALRETFPASLRRTMNDIREPDRFRKLTLEDIAPENLGKLAKELKQPPRASASLLKLRTLATKRLRELVEPKLDSQTHQVALSRSGTEALDTLALLQLLDMVEIMHSMTSKRMHPLVTDFSKMYIQAQTSKDAGGVPVRNTSGKYFYGMTIGPKGEDGQIRTSTHMSFAVEKQID